MTPKEAWSAQRPSVNHFKIFGCRAYAHILDEKRRKLNDKGEKCIFLGVSDQSKAYKIKNPSTKKIITSCAVFYEEKFWSWNNEGGTQQILVDFDGEEGQQLMENLQQPTIRQDESIIDPNSPAITPTQRPQCVRRQPA